MTEKPSRSAVEELLGRVLPTLGGPARRNALRVAVMAALDGKSAWQSLMGSFTYTSPAQTGARMIRTGIIADLHEYYKVLGSDEQILISFPEGEPKVKEDIDFYQPSFSFRPGKKSKRSHRSQLGKPGKPAPKCDELRRKVEEVFEADLHRLGKTTGLGEARIRRHLQWLAYAEGPGLPYALWEELAGESVDVVRHYAAALVLRYLENGEPVWGLSQNRLKDYLYDEDISQDRHRRIAEKLIGAVPKRDWLLGSDSYARKHLAAHAAKARLLDQLAKEVGFLAFCDPARLLAVAHAVTDDEARKKLEWFRLTADRLTGCSPTQRLSYLELTAEQNGAIDFAKNVRRVDVFRAWETRWARWCPATPHLILLKTDGELTPVSISKGVVFTADGNGLIWLWNFDSGERHAEPLQGQEGGVRALAASEHNVAAGGNDGTIRIWDRSTRRRIGEDVPGHQGKVNAVVIGDFVVSGGSDGTVRRWSMTDGRQVGDCLSVHAGWITAVATRGEYVVSGADDGALRVWCSGVLQPQALQESDDRLSGVGIAGDIIVSGGSDGAIRLCHFDGTPVRSPLREHTCGVTALAASGDTIVSGDASTSYS